MGSEADSDFQRELNCFGVLIDVIAVEADDCFDVFVSCGLFDVIRRCSSRIQEGVLFFALITGASLAPELATRFPNGHRENRKIDREEVS